MSGISKEPDPRVLNYVKFYSARMQGMSEQDIARTLGFLNSTGYPSPSTLYQRLQADGFPVCSLCGFTPTTDPFHCKKPEGKLRKPPRRREAVVKLPPAHQAVPLFKDALKALAREIEELRDRQEIMQGERFVGMVNKEYLGWWVYRRKNFPDEGEWEELCRQYGEDPDKEEIKVRAGIVPTSLGALQAPAEPLTTLIGVCGLIKGSKRTRAVDLNKDNPTTAWSIGLFSLIRSLHPDAQGADWTQNVDWEMVDQAQKDLRRAAINFAKVVRGGEIRRGPGPEEVLPEYMGALRLIEARRQEGAAETQITKELAELGFTSKAITWLKKLRLHIPPPLD